MKVNDDDSIEKVEVEENSDLESGDKEEQKLSENAKKMIVSL